MEQFLYREARLLDTRAFDAWLELWTPDGMYWLPHEPGQASPHDHISLFWKMRRCARCARAASATRATGRNSRPRAPRGWSAT
ncbi:aromatic-ring-hydroxylating dioxygenase subunit beta [Burkholderia gladioli]|uniref:aromatic-ring-hydroxylating dioxygenase subunit beta n=1 Tax=Burkholderia gladioli TaxID=28095 RepID=UPI003D1D627F